MSREPTPSRLPAWVPIVWLSALIVTLVIPARVAHASHPNSSTYKHINTMHYASEGNTGRDEQFCVQSHDTAKMSHATARAFINETLTAMGAGRVWDGLGSWRIDMWPTNYHCSHYDTGTLDTIEIRVNYGWDWSYHCGGTPGYFNCVAHADPIWNPDHNHYDSRHANVYLVFSSGGRLDTVGRGFINHEFGHVFGLADDNGVCNPPSIMHSTVVGYSCANWPYWYPSPADFQSVLNLM